MQTLNQLKSIFSNIICSYFYSGSESGVGRIRYNSGNDGDNCSEGNRIRLTDGNTFRYSKEREKGDNFSVELKAGDNFAIKIHELATSLGLNPGDDHSKFFMQVMGYFDDEGQGNFINKDSIIKIGDELLYINGYVEIKRDGKKINFVKIDNDIISLIENDSNYQQVIKAQYKKIKKDIVIEASDKLSILHKGKEEYKQKQVEQKLAEQKQAEQKQADQKILDKKLADQKILEKIIANLKKRKQKKPVQKLVEQKKIIIPKVKNKPLTKAHALLDRIYDNGVALNKSDLEKFSEDFNEQERKDIIVEMSKDLHIGKLTAGNKEREGIIYNMKKAGLIKIKNNTEIVFNPSEALVNLKNIPDALTLKQSFGFYREPLESVALIQLYLKTTGIDIVVDGIPGKGTLAAIRKYYRELDNKSKIEEIKTNKPKTKKTEVKKIKIKTKKIETKKLKIVKKNIPVIKPDKGLAKLYANKIEKRRQQKNTRLEKSYKETSKLLENALDAYNNKDTLGAIHCTDWIDKMYIKTYGKSIYDFGSIFDGVGKTKFGTGIGVKNYASKNMISKIKPGNHIIVDKPPYKKGKTHSIMALGVPIDGLIDVISYPHYNKPPLKQKYDLFGKGRGDRDGMPIRIQGV